MNLIFIGIIALGVIVGLIMVFNFGLISAEEQLGYDDYKWFMFKNDTDYLLSVHYTDNDPQSLNATKIEPQVIGDHHVFKMDTTYHVVYLPYTKDDGTIGYNLANSHNFRTLPLIVENHDRINHLESELAKQIQRQIDFEQDLTELRQELNNLKNP